MTNFYEYYTRSQLISDINKKLAGENLSFAELQLHIDSAIDDINAALNACYPTTSEMERTWEAVANDPTTVLPEDYRNWNAYDTPDNNAYLTLFPAYVTRRVIVLGAALKWLTTDEEGLATSPEFEKEYKNELFLLQRDYSNKVPTHYQASEQGFVHDSFHNTGISFSDYMSGPVRCELP